MASLGKAQTSVRIYRTDYTLLVWRQANAVEQGHPKPSIAELIHLAIAKLAEDK